MIQEAEVVTQSPSFRRSAEAEIIIKKMDEKAEGDEITYLELHALTGIPSDKEDRMKGVLNTARRAQLRKGIVWGVVAGIGVRRLLPGEIVDVEENVIQRVHRQANRSARRLSCADPERLDKKQRHALAERSAALAVLGHLSSRPVRNKLRQMASKDGNAFTPDAAVKMLLAAGL